MKINSLASNGARPLIAEFEFPAFAISWAGEHPWTEGFCFGSEDGRLLLTTDEGQAELGLTETAPSHEAINGVAFLNGTIAVSTRSDVAFITLNPGAGKKLRAVYGGGAHGITATRSGYYVAPLGRGGLLRVKPEAGPQQPLTVSLAHDLYFYRVIGVAAGDSELLVCALRNGGVASLPLLADLNDALINSITFPGLDVVDVCAIDPDMPSAPVAAVGRNGALILLRDVAHDRHPVTLRFDDIEGAAYRVFSHQGHLFLLTSKALYVFADLARRFLEGQDITHHPTPVRTLPLEAVDANLAGPRWLLVVLPEKTLRIDLDLLVGNAPSPPSLDGKHNATATRLTPAWTQHEAPLTDHALAAV